MDWKKFTYFVETHKQAEMLIKLEQHGYKIQGQFVRDVIEAYTNEDPDFMIWMNKKIIEKGNANTKGRLEKKQKLINKAEQLTELLFSQQDINNIFDLIEEKD
jgi:hypothetical protein